MFDLFTFCFSHRMQFALSSFQKCRALTVHLRYSCCYTVTRCIYTNARCCVRGGSSELLIGCQRLAKLHRSDVMLGIATQCSRQHGRGIKHLMLWRRQQQQQQQQHVLSFNAESSHQHPCCCCCCCCLRDVSALLIGIISVSALHATLCQCQ